MWSNFVRLLNCVMLIKLLIFGIVGLFVVLFIKEWVMFIVFFVVFLSVFLFLKWVDLFVGYFVFGWYRNLGLFY